MTGRNIDDVVKNEETCKYYEAKCIEELWYKHDAFKREHGEKLYDDLFFSTEKSVKNDDDMHEIIRIVMEDYAKKFHVRPF